MSWALYVHVPWCKAVCPYCAFYVVRERGTLPAQSFAEAVLDELGERRPSFPGDAATLYFGGGTPSRLPVEALKRIVEGAPLAADAEVTAEVNPEDGSDTWIRGALDACVNRFSVGVQTLSDHHARSLGRAHSSRQATDVARRIAGSGARSWSMDLMFALPGQTLEDLEADLDAVLDLSPPHVALYGLTIEPGTPFERKRDRGTLVELDEGLWRRMYDRIVLRLQRAGLARYEVSNFARPGHESRHNRHYWTDMPYMGLGPAAHGYQPDGVRYHNARDLTAWLRGERRSEVERPTARSAAADLLVCTMRSCAGLDLSRLEARTGFGLEPSSVDALITAGMVTSTSDRIALTHAGFPLADAVTARLIDALVPADRSTG